MTTLGILSDTHIPDRASELDARITQRFREACVAAILHAGDVSIPKVLRELEKIAPVHAVRGNRDIFALNSLPLQVRINIDAVAIGMAHGHGTFSRYMLDKIRRRFDGSMIGRSIQRMLHTFTDVEVIVFGHSHVPCNVYINGKLLFNPGSTSYPGRRGKSPTFGLLYLEQSQKPRGEIIELRK